MKKINFRDTQHKSPRIFIVIHYILKFVVNHIAQVCYISCNFFVILHERNKCDGKLGHFKTKNMENNSNSEVKYGELQKCLPFCKGFCCEVMTSFAMLDMFMRQCFLVSLDDRQFGRTAHRPKERAAFDTISVHLSILDYSFEV